MKKLIYIVLLSLAPMLAFSQVYVKAPSGHVGVGIDTPTQKLDVDGNVNVRGNTLHLGSGNTGTTALRVGHNRASNGHSIVDYIGRTNYPLYGLRMGYLSKGYSIMYHRGTLPFIIKTIESASIQFRTSNTHRMSINGNGKVGIGTTSPNTNTLLDVKGAIGYNGTLVNTSDKRLKSNAKDFNYGLDEVLSLSPIFYNYNGKAGTNADQTHVGIYAQDLGKVAPKLVEEFIYQEDAEIIEENDGLTLSQSSKKAPETYLSINESAIKYMLINAVKEQQEIIETQDEKIATLEERLAKIEATLKLQNTGINQQNIQLDGRGAYLEQNQPNPFNNNTLIKYHIPTDANNAMVNIMDMNGQLIHTESIARMGAGEIQLKAGTIAAGTYSYSLIVNGKVLDTKRMIIIK